MNRLKRIVVCAMAFTVMGFCSAEKLVVEIVNAVDSLPVNGVDVTAFIPGNDPIKDHIEGNIFTYIFQGKEIAFEFSHKDYNTIKREFKLTQPKESCVVALEPKSETLEEVVVTPELLKVYADREEMFLTKENQNFGTSAIDAISSLPQFLPTINGNSIKTLAGSDVQIVIDGRLASNQELINLKGTRISKVVLYKNPPAKYAGRVNGEIIEVFIVRPKEISVEGNARVTSCLTCPQLYANVGVNLLDQTNYGGVLYSGLYKNIFGVSDTKNVYDYGNVMNTLSSVDSHTREFSNSVSGFYQYNKGRNMFYVGYDYLSDPGLERINYKLTETGLSDNLEGESLSFGTINRQNHKANLYYSREFGNGSELYADIVSTWQNNRRKNILSQDVSEGSGYDSFYSETKSHNNNYSFIGAVGYTLPLKNGSLSFSEYLNYYRFNQDYYYDLHKSGYVRNTPEMIDNYFSAGYSFNKNRFSLSAFAGLTANAYNIKENDKTTDIIPTGRLNVSYRFSNCFTLRAMGNISVTKPNTSELNNNFYVIDTRYFSVNNPYLKNSTKYLLWINGVISLPGNKVVIQPEASYYYDYHSILSNLYIEDGNVFRQRVNIEGSNNVDYGTSLSWRITNIIMLSGNIKASHLRYNIKGNNVIFNSVTGSASAMIFLSNFSGNLSFFAHSVRMNGLIKSQTPGFLSIEGNYNLKNWNFGLKYQYSIGNNKVKALIDGFSMDNEISLGRFKNFVNATVSYRFNLGKQYGKKQKSVDNSERDTGL